MDQLRPPLLCHARVRGRTVRTLALIPPLIIFHCCCVLVWRPRPAVGSHPGHTHFPINAGMWGGTREALPCLDSALSTKAAGLVKCDHCLAYSTIYHNDQLFLSRIVWPIAKNDMLHHAAYGCTARDNLTTYGPSVPFPTPRNGTYVGAVYQRHEAIDRISYLWQLCTTKGGPVPGRPRTERCSYCGGG